VYSLPSQYILNRWTKYAKRGFYIDKQGSEEEDLKARAALISRKATTIALKCSVSRELLDDFQKAIEKLDQQADTSLSKMQEESNEVPLIPNECDTGSLNGVISFRVPQVVKGPKNTRFKNVVEKKTVKSKKKSAKKKGSDPTHSRCFSSLMVASIINFLCSCFVICRRGSKYCCRKWRWSC